MKTKLLSLTVILLTAAVAIASEALNVDKNGLALQGYDPVAYITDNHPVKGDPNLTASYNGATYQFASAEHQKAFKDNPTKYEPQFGGFCGYAASIN